MSDDEKMSSDKPVRIGGLFQTPLSDEQKANSELNSKEFEAGTAELKSYPKRVLLEFTNMCNYRCVMCGRNYSSFRPSYLNTKVIDDLEEVFQHSEEVTLFGWGEPTLHPEFSEIMRKLSGFKTLRKYMLTNGSNLDFVKKLVKEGALDILAISIDGATAEMNNAIRCGSDFDYITSKIKEIVAMKDEGHTVPYMNLVFVIMNKNVHQLPDMVRLTKELGLPELKAVYLTSFHADLDDETIWVNPDDYKKHFEEATKVAEEIGVAVKFPPFIGDDPTGDASHKPCAVGWRDLFISSDGSVRPCQSTGLKIADVKDYDMRKDFFSMWNCKEFQDFRKTVNDEDRMDVNCKACYQSSHANWNKKHSHLRHDDEAIPEWNMD